MIFDTKIFTLQVHFQVEVIFTAFTRWEFQTVQLPAIFSFKMDTDIMQLSKVYLFNILPVSSYQLDKLQKCICHSQVDTVDDRNYTQQI